MTSSRLTPANAKTDGCKILSKHLLAHGWRQDQGGSGTAASSFVSCKKANPALFQKEPSAQHAEVIHLKSHVMSKKDFIKTFGGQLNQDNSGQRVSWRG